MNLDDKLKLAHEWAMSMLAKDPRYSDATDFDVRAWQYADAMEAEYNKRKVSGFPDALKEEFQPDWSVAHKK